MSTEMGISSFACLQGPLIRMGRGENKVFSVELTGETRTWLTDQSLVGEMTRGAANRAYLHNRLDLYLNAFLAERDIREFLKEAAT